MYSYNYEGHGIPQAYDIRMIDDFKLTEGDFGVIYKITRIAD
jgi:hypothetical protein